MTIDGLSGIIGVFYIIGVGRCISGTGHSGTPGTPYYQKIIFSFSGCLPFLHIF